MFIDTGVLASLLEADLVANAWDGSCEPYPGQSKHQFTLMALRRSLLKKYLPGTPKASNDAQQKALNLFLEINDRCKGFDLGLQVRNEAEEIAIGEAKAFLYDFFYPKPVVRREWVTPFAEMQEVCYYRDFILRPSSFIEGVGCGPGAAVGSLSTDFYTKLATSHLTATDQALYSDYVQTIHHHPTWTECETNRSKVRGVRIVSGSRLSFVPKTAEICRTICSEPILNMFFQKGIQYQLEKRLREFVGIDLTNQPDENARLARIGSVTQRFGTIDLKSASDSLSLSLMREILPPEVFKLLVRYRSPTATLPSGEEVELHMISSMGNAFTFPLQTIVFAAVVVGVYKVLGIRPNHFRGRSSGRSNFAVFGDDIIVEQRAYRMVTRLLTIFGFIVNHDKSFNEGPFRESCGSDYFSGHNVRGVYIDSLEDANDLYSAINRLNVWSAKHRIALPRLVSFLFSKVRKLFVPFDEMDTAGIKVPLCFYDDFKSTYANSIRLVLYRKSVLLDRRFSVLTPEEKVASQIGFFTNPAGLLLSFVGGYIRNGYIGLRSNARHAVIRKGSTPRWDWIPLPPGESPEFREAWKCFTVWNLR